MCKCILFLPLSVRSIMIWLILRQFVHVEWWCFFFHSDLFIFFFLMMMSLMVRGHKMWLHKILVSTKCSSQSEFGIITELFLFFFWYLTQWFFTLRTAQIEIGNNICNILHHACPCLVRYLVLVSLFTFMNESFLSLMNQVIRVITLPLFSPNKA